MGRKSKAHFRLLRRLFRQCITCFKEDGNEKGTQEIKGPSSINSTAKQDNLCEFYSGEASSMGVREIKVHQDDSHPPKAGSCQGKLMNAKRRDDVDVTCDVPLSSPKYVTGNESGSITGPPENNTMDTTAFHIDRSRTPSTTDEPGEVLVKHFEESNESSCDYVSRPSIANDGNKSVEPQMSGAGLPTDKNLAFGGDDEHCQRNNAFEIDDQCNKDQSSSTITDDVSVKKIEPSGENESANRTETPVEKESHTKGAQSTEFQLQEQGAAINDQKDSKVSEELFEDMSERPRRVPELLQTLATSPPVHYPQLFQEMSSSATEKASSQQSNPNNAALLFDENNMMGDKTLSAQRTKFPDRETSSIALEPGATLSGLDQDLILQHVNIAYITSSQQQDVGLSTDNPDDHASVDAEQDVHVDGQRIDADTTQVTDPKTVEPHSATSKTDLLEDVPLKSKDLESLSSPHILQYSKDAPHDNGLPKQSGQADEHMAASSGVLRIHHEAHSSSAGLHYSQSIRAYRLQRRMERFRHYFEALRDLDQFGEENQEKQSRLNRFRRFFEDA